MAVYDKRGKLIKSSATQMFDDVQVKNLTLDDSVRKAFNFGDIQNELWDQTVSKEKIEEVVTKIYQEGDSFGYSRGLKPVVTKFSSNSSKAYVALKLTNGKVTSDLILITWVPYTGVASSCHGKFKKKKSIKSEFEENENYGFRWSGEYIYDKDDNHWYFGDYINGNIEPYLSYMQAVKETADSVRDFYWEDEIADPEDYAYQLVDFAVETMEDPGKFIKEYEGFVKSSRKPIKSSVDKQRVKEELDNPYYDIENPERYYDIQFNINWEDIAGFAISWDKYIKIDPKEIVSVEYDDSVPASYQDVNNMDYDAIDGAYLVKFKDGTSKSYGWTYGGDKLKLMSSVHSSCKPIKSSNLIKSNVEIDDDIFIELLWDRVNSFTPAKGYDDEFWTECFDYLSEIGWMRDPWKNDPKYIVDNIAVNGEIFALEDCADNYDEINNDYEGDVDAWIEDKGYPVFGDYVVINLGLD